MLVPDDDLAGGELHEGVERLEGDERADEPRQRRLPGPRRPLQRPLLRHRRPGPGHRRDNDPAAAPTVADCFLRPPKAAGGAGACEDGRHFMEAFLEVLQ